MFTKKDLVSKIAENNESTKVEAERIYGVVLESIKDLILDETENGLDLHGIIKLEVVDKPARTARNPKTGETIEVPETTVLTAKLSPKTKRLQF